MPWQSHMTERAGSIWRSSGDYLAAASKMPRKARRPHRPRSGHVEDRERRGISFRRYRREARCNPYDAKEDRERAFRCPGKLLVRICFDPSRPHSRDNAEVARAVTVLMKSGLWDTCVHPLTADRAVIASAHVGSLPDSWRDRSFSTWTGEALIAALGELDEGVRISTERRNGHAAITNPLIATLVERSLGYLASKRDFATDGMNTEEVLWRLSRDPRVGSDVLGVALHCADADNTYQTPDPIKNLARAYGISVARKSEQEPLSSVLAAAMKADPVPAEFLISLGYRQAGDEAVVRTTHVDWMATSSRPFPMRSSSTLMTLPSTGLDASGIWLPSA